MQRSFVIILVTLFMSSCAGNDRFAEQSSLLALRHAMERCASSLPANDPKKYFDLTSCQMSAERDFAMATHMTRMDVFDVYASEMRKIGADLDADKFAPGEAMERTNEIRQEFLTNCDCTLLGTKMLRMTGPVVAGPARGLTVSAKVGPLVKEAQSLAQAENYKAALVKLDQADAVKSTADDATVISQMTQYIARKIFYMRAKQPPSPSQP